MCDPVVGLIALDAVMAAAPYVAGGIAAKGVADSMKPNIPGAPAAPADAPKSQAAQQPDQAALRAAATSRTGGGASETMLTGPGGVAPSLLSIGKNSLLGA